MAFTRNFLKGLDLESDVIDKIIDEHTKTTGALKDSISALEKERDEFKDKSAQLEDITKERDELKANAGNYDKLKKEYDDYKTSQEGKENKSKLEKAFKGILKEAGISEKRFDAIIRVTDLSKYKLDSSGNIENSKDVVNATKEEWKEFVQTSSQKGVTVPKSEPGGNSSGKKYESKEKILEIKDPVDRQQAIADNPELFGIATE